MHTDGLGSIQIQCGYCDKTSRQKIMADCVQWIPAEHPYASEGDWTLVLSLCPSCAVVNLSVTYDSSDNPFVLYPDSLSRLHGLPQNIAKAYQAARAVRLVDTNAFAVLLGRVLELICRDRKASGETLYLQIDDLSKRSEIPGPLADMANQLRILRNFGAHATAVELTHKEIPILDELCQAILEYIYVLPYRVQKIKQHVQTLNHPNY